MLSAQELAARFAASRTRLEQALAAGEAGGALARRLSDDVDAVLLELMTQVPDGVAVLATGGYGRRELAPYSDLDLLVLCAGPPGDAARAFADATLYPLWDAKVDAGHAVRSAEEALALPATDLAAATALLDARLLSGDAALAARFLRDFATRAAAEGAAGLLARLRDEQRARHARFGSTIFLLEPDLKNGPGGYRDLCVGRWAAKARFGSGEPQALAAAGHMSPRRAAAVEEALEWFLRVRVAAQLAVGRRQDHLRFAVQEAIAPQLYPDARAAEGEVRPAVAPAVEQLMHQFQRHARTVRRETERLLERAVAGGRSGPAAPVTLPGAPAPDPVLVLREGALEAADADAFSRRPSEMVRIFAAAVALGRSVAPRTRDLIADRVAADAAPLRADADAARLFLALLADTRDVGTPAQLEEMQDVGLLAALMPEWEPVAGRVQHDIYHVYTVDQHSLYAVARLQALARGDLAEAYPVVTEAVRAVERPLALQLGTLLHDVGKPHGGQDHSERGAVLVPVIAARLGVAADDARRAEFLVRQHLVMSHLSQRRDLGDLGMIADFARLCGDEENLRELYVLTFCDLSAVSPGNLTSWKEALLRELYERTLAFLRRGPDLLGAERAALVRQRKRQAARRLGEDAAGPELAGLFGSLPDRYFAENTAQRIAAHVALIRSRRGLPCLVDVRPRRKLGFSEMVLVADDTPGLLAVVAGVLLANRIDVVDAAIYSREPARVGERGEAVDLFRVRDAYGRAVTDERRWATIRADLAAVLTGRIDVATLLASRPAAVSFGGRRAPEVLTEMRFDNDVSRDFTVVEVVTQDRPGVLYAIARTLFDLGLDIHRSKVATEGNRVADVFYVRDGQTGQKLTDDARVDELRSVLLRALPV